ncbi:MAG: alkaline phosphatase family protein [Burkholderiaceae bacterium]
MSITTSHAATSTIAESSTEGRVAAWARRRPFETGATLVNLAAALGRRFGADPGLAPLRVPGLERARGVVLMLIDGAGLAQIDALVPGGALARFRVGRLSSVFPSSTAPALTSLASALAPAQHGNAGWFVWNPARRRVVRSLPLDVRGDPSVAVDAAELWSWRPLSAAVSDTMVVIQPDTIATSGFSRYAYAGATLRGYDGTDAIETAILEAVDAHPEGGFVYAYAPQFDAVAHAAGCRSDEAAHVLQRFDEIFASLVDSLADSGYLLLATADHGFVDIEPASQLSIGDFPAVARLLARPLCGEPRVAFVTIEPAAEDALVRAVGAEMGFALELERTEVLLRAGWFGDVEPSREFVDATGTHVLIMREGYTIGDRVAGESPPAFLGMHGGTGEAEMRIALAAAYRGGRPSPA